MKPTLRLLIPVIAAAALLVLASCWDGEPAPRQEPVPAAIEAERLRSTEPPAAAEVRDLRAQELGAAKAAAVAEAAGDTAQAERQHRLAAELATIRTAAEQREQEQRQQIAALAAEADRRAVDERGELDRRSAAADREAEARQAEHQRQVDRRWAGWGIALSVVIAVALRIAGLPGILAFGLPTALAAGCLTLAAWSSVPWLATALGIILAAAVAIVLALVVRQVVREWADYADRLRLARPEAKAQADVASLGRQPAWLRWILDHLLAHHAAISAPSRLPGPHCATRAGGRARGSRLEGEPDTAPALEGRSDPAVPAASHRCLRGGPTAPGRPAARRDPRDPRGPPRASCQAPLRARQGTPALAEEPG